MKNHQFCVSVLCALLTTWSINACAANPCALTPYSQDGIGGTGIYPQDGIGGTGHTPQDGIGGTGQKLLKGIGGTGQKVVDIGGTGQKLAIIGVVTGFASICVNGEEVHFEDSTSVTVNGEQANTSNLSVGQVVAITADKTPKGWTASNISTNDAVTGPITKLSAPNRAIIAGQIVNLPNEYASGANKKQFAVGQSVRVQGLRLLNGEILATSATSTNSRLIVVSGLVEKLPNGLVRVGGLNVGNLAPNLAVNGQLISISGRMAGSTLQVTNARRALQIDANAQQLSIQSAVISSQGGRIQLNNGTVINTANNAAQNYKAGRMVQISAVKDENGNWQSTQINNQSHADLMRRAGDRQNNSGRGNDNKSDANGEEDKTEDDNKNLNSNLGEDSNSRSGSNISLDSDSVSNSGSSSNSRSTNLDKSPTSERPTTLERSNETDRSNSRDRGNDSIRSGTADRPNAEDRSRGSDRPSATDRPSAADRPSSGNDRPVRVERPTANDRSSGGDRVRVDRPNAVDRPSGSDRPSGGDRIRNEVSGGSGGSGSGRR